MNAIPNWKLTTKSTKKNTKGTNRKKFSHRGFCKTAAVMPALLPGINPADAANYLLDDRYYDNLSGQQAYKCFACRVRKA
jgi:hypothetical protein